MNKVIDALLKKEAVQIDEEAQCRALTTLQSAWLTEVLNIWDNDEVVQSIMAKLVAGSDEVSCHTFFNDTLRYNGKLYIGSTGDLRSIIIQELHNSGSGGHSGLKATLTRIIQFFYWPNMATTITNAVKE